MVLIVRLILLYSGRLMCTEIQPMVVIGILILLSVGYLDSCLLGVSDEPLVIRGGTMQAWSIQVLQCPAGRC